jgi:ribosomal protein L13E
MDKQQVHRFFTQLLQRFDRKPPRAMVVYGRRVIAANGFSLAELAEANISPERAHEIGVDVDPARMSSLGANVDSLRRYRLRLGS